ncbi:TPA: hypothetical protein HA338_10685 [Methanosarcina acetivorans]|uniref:TFIIEalpha/SarR/Rpc3 HTH domain-containing protein n=2 Tax=Methanosarcina acetivorans TaxID=2214 RepID=Q8TNR9_METAC|nr:hypothetical protein [Methanosarcina acetivorans]AAM05609.1 predicted protein [Methanosarcina acetivorans C2A]HIH94463.1 hypothetical protein [Methanosarcina acetivorans]
MEIIFESIIKESIITVDDVATELSYDRDDAKKRLNRLVDKEIIVESLDDDYPDAYKINWEMYEIRKRGRGKRENP